MKMDLKGTDYKQYEACFNSKTTSGTTMVLL
jgi:hypothetical protein